MKVLHFILGKANKNRANGVNQVIAGLAKNLCLQGCELRVLGKAETVKSEGGLIQRDGFQVKAFSRVSLEFYREIRDSVRWADIIHLHGVYNPWNLAVALFCKLEGKPFVLTLHDGLAAARLKSRRRWLKWIYNLLIQRRHVASASTVHVLTEEESTDLVNFGYCGEIVVIHNGVDLDEFAKPLPFNLPAEGRKLRIGYLGRFSKEKNVGSLLAAFSNSFVHDDVELVLAGPESEYLNKLLAVHAMDRISWVGPRYGDEKLEFLKSIDLFVHPAYCDVFSIAAMEVLAAGRPLLITRTSNASYFFDRNAFFMCEPTEFGLRCGMKQAVSARNKWRDYSVAGRALVEETFNWGTAAKHLIRAYESTISGKGN